MVRVKSRYFILLVKPKDGKAYDTIGPALPGAIRSSIQLHLGDAALAAANANFAVPYYHHLSGVAIVRIGRSEHQQVLRCCLRLSQVDFRGVSISLLRLTGAFRVAKREAGRHIDRLMAGQTLSPQQQAVAAALKERLAALY